MKLHEAEENLNYKEGELWKSINSLYQDRGGWREHDIRDLYYKAKEWLKATEQLEEIKKYECIFFPSEQLKEAKNENG